MYIPTLDDEFYNQPLNLDITNRCPLQCPACLRQSGWYKENRKLYKEMSVGDIIKCAKTISRISLCGQQSDPLCHSQILDILWILHSVNLDIHTATSHNSEEFYEEAFNLSGKKTTWVFGLDGLPEDSHKHRVNQNGVHLFEMMKMGARMGANIAWQYLVFNYNQDSISYAKKMSEHYGIEFRLSKSSRWDKTTRHLKPDEYWCA